MSSQRSRLEKDVNFFIENVVEYVDFDNYALERTSLSCKAESLTSVFNLFFLHLKKKVKIVVKSLYYMHRKITTFFDRKLQPSLIGVYHGGNQNPY